MRQGTLFLRLVVFIMGIPILAVSIFWLPGLAAIIPRAEPELAFLQYVFLAGIYAAVIPYCIALYQTLKLLGYIDKNTAFSELSVQSLKKIKHSAVAICILFALDQPIFYILAQADDAPGIVAIGLIIIGASTVIAVFAAVLQKLLQNAIEIKSENDLTV